jgi:hypothetical protein
LVGTIEAGHRSLYIPAAGGNLYQLSKYEGQSISTVIVSVRYSANLKNKCICMLRWILRFIFNLWIKKGLSFTQVTSLITH